MADTDKLLELTESGHWIRECDQLRTDRDRLQAELATARAELERLRGELHDASAARVRLVNELVWVINGRQEAAARLQAVAGLPERFDAVADSWDEVANRASAMAFRQCARELTEILAAGSADVATARQTTPEPAAAISPKPPGAPSCRICEYHGVPESGCPHTGRTAAPEPTEQKSEAVAGSAKLDILGTPTPTPKPQGPDVRLLKEGQVPPKP